MVNFKICIALIFIGLSTVKAQCTNPTLQTSVLRVTQSDINSSSLQWVRGNGDAVIVVGRLNAAVNELPLNGTVYSGNANFGSGTNLGNGNFVVYVGTGNSLQITNLLPNQSYHFAAFEFNNLSDPCFLTDNPPRQVAYCKPQALNGGRITNVTITDLQTNQTILQNSNSIQALGNYQFFGNVAAPVLHVGGSYNFSITREGSGQRRLNVLIDYDDNGFLNLEAAGPESETIYNLAPPNLNTISFDYTVPAIATPGRKLIRFRSFAQATAVGICLNASVAGETEDYYIEISDEPIPPTCTVSIQPAEASICSGSQITLQASGATSFTWSPADGLSCTDCPSPFASPAQSTIYEVIGVTGDCRDTTYYTVTVNQPQTFQIELANAPFNNLCNGPLTLLAPSSFSNIIWSNGVSNQPSISVNQVGNFSATATDQGGCNVTSNTIAIISTPSPEVTIIPSGSIPLCGESITLTANQGLADYLWSNGSSEISITVQNPGTYSLTGTDLLGCSAQSNEVNLFDAELPTADYSFDQVPDTYQMQFTFGGQGATAYFWDFGNGQTSNEENPLVDFLADGEYTVTLIVTNECGSDTITKQVVLIKTSILNMEAQWNIFPNPFHDLVNIKAGFAINQSASIRIIDLSGAEIEAFRLVDNQAQLLLNYLPAGVYLIKIDSEHHSITRKLIKM